ncbi:transcriptional coactivator/pterin dehydratase [Bombardia bombarda]|uniref:4a-hydroxytetrahydrobiopterin dehydratase n=1 Tax=Bombardia bombarda TaxID=252184 RepID=A0AA40CGG5_9PEZI|nr:transcriptional coactivator/pterin dehydratase [Bombardia bombarda]
MPQPPKFSSGSEPSAMEAALAPLLSTDGGRWSLSADGHALERTFKFKTFAKTWDFMTAVSLSCKVKNHHPEWSNASLFFSVFNMVFIRWTTHSPKGLSDKDIDLAQICDEIAKDFGEIIEESTATTTCELAGLTDKVVTSAGDCCIPKTEK